MAKVGFIGLGHMGLPMALNLVKAGHDVVGFDLRKEAVQAFTNLGGIPGKNLQDAVINQEFFITMLQSGEQVLNACLGEHGLYAAASHAMHIDCSTIDVASSRKLHQEADKKHVLSLDAPVSGGVTGATAATLTFMVGGREYDIEKATPLLKAMGKSIIHTGGAGSGQAAKICNNMVLGMSMIAVSEAFLLAEQLGLSHHKLHEVLTQASGNCWTVNHYVPVSGVLPNMPAEHEYQPGFAVAMMLKDLMLSQESAVKSALSLPLAERATQLYQQFYDQGFGGLDFSAIIKSLGQPSVR